MNRMSEPGLIYRRVFRKDDGEVVVEEKWDMRIPHCPYIRSPWYSGPDPGPVFLRQVTMSEAEYMNCEIPLYPDNA